MTNQLYSLSEENFRLPLGIDSNGTVITVQADNIPILSWPDGRWCFEANLYMLELYNRGLSRTNDGGTLKTYAANISHLLRYCFRNNIDFIKLTDSQFIMFIRQLQGETNSKFNTRMRNANTVINIGRNCLDFLELVSKFYNQPNLLGKKGQIRAERKEAKVNALGNSYNNLGQGYWHHSAFPMPDSKVRMLPINTANIKKLNETINRISTSYYLRRRRQIMLMMLGITGGRRGEIAALSIQSVMKAHRMQKPMLDLITLKKRGNPIRTIPIPRPDLDMLVSFIEKQRRTIIKNTIGLGRDHGYVFVSETTGKPLRAQTLSQEIYVLAKTAGIEEKACAHMFRHRFITKLFVTLIERHAFENVDDFRRALLDTEAIKQKVQQWTGHKNTASLSIYINLAFEEISDFKKSYDKLKFSRLVDSVRNQTAYLRDEIACGVPGTKVLTQLEKMLAGLEREVDAYANQGEI